LHSKRLFLSSGFSTVLGQNFRNFRHCEKLSLSWTGDFDLLKNDVKVRKLKDNLKLHGEKYKNSGCQTFTVMMKSFGCIAELMLDGIASTCCRRGVQVHPREFSRGRRGTDSLYFDVNYVRGTYRLIQRPNRPLRVRHMAPGSHRPSEMFTMAQSNVMPAQTTSVNW
jgi:hypothetical protein